MKIESGLRDFLRKHYGSWESVEIVKDNGKSILLKIDFGDDEEITVGINRRKGDNGNYRIYAES